MSRPFQFFPTFFLPVFPDDSLGVHFSRNDFIHVTPDPVFSRLNRTHDGMLFMMKMFRGMLILGRVAASCVAANHAHPQMHPGVAGFDAVFADVLTGRRNFDLIQMFALA
jgi:hypothetical protein